MVMTETSGKLYYSMGEVAEMLDVEPSLVRFWEGKFDIIKPKRNKKGNRMFTPGDVDNLKTIYHLVKERRMTLEGAQKQMKANRSGIGRDMELAERLHSIRSLLLEVRQSLGGDGTVVDDTPGVLEIIPAAIPEDIPAIKALETELENAATGITATVTTPVPAPAPAPESVSEPEPEPAPAAEPEPEEETEHIIEQAQEEEVIDALMDDVFEAMNSEPEEMPDFDPAPDFEPEPEPEEEPAEETPQKPTYIEQTLF